jgi:hypothetical protein
MTQPFIGIQLGSHSVFDEGAAHILDLLQEKAQINALFVYSHAYQKIVHERPLDGLADHGKGTRAAVRNLGHRWVGQNEEHYARTFLRHPETPDAEYSGRDVFDELIPEARARGMKVYGRMLEGFDRFLPTLIDNWTKVLSVDVYGRREPMPCANNPQYLAWMTSTVEDVATAHELDGYKYGAERSGPLSHLLIDGKAPGCFCDYCIEVGVAEGIDVDRAIVGFRALHRFAEASRRGEQARDGFFVTFLRIILQYPEILAWQRLWYRKMSMVSKSIYGTIKSVSPDTQVGWHVWHGVTWDPFHQAEMDYAEMADYSDWIKPVIYHDIAGVRFREWAIEPFARTLFADQKPEQVRSLLFELLGYDSTREATLDKLDTTGMSIEYVWREIRRAVLAVDGKAEIYSGVGFDVPTNGNPMRSAPERVFDAAYRSFEAGASGLLVSREYDEMRIENLEAVGRAITRAQADGLA